MKSGRGGKWSSVSTIGVPLVHTICIPRWMPSRVRGDAIFDKHERACATQVGHSNILLIQSIEVEYTEEYIIVERIDSRV